MVQANIIKICVEKFDDVSCEIMPLLIEHYEELTLNKDVVKLNVDWNKYKNLELNGILKIVTARLGGVLIGYSIFFVYNHIHYKELKVASNDVLFLSKEYRSKSTAGIKLIKESEKYLESIGVNKINWHIKSSNDWSSILLRMGYANEEVILGKILGRKNGH